MDGLGFTGASSAGAGAFLLNPDLVQNKSQAGNGSQEGTQNLGNEGVLAGQLTEGVQLLGGSGRSLPPDRP